MTEVFDQAHDPVKLATIASFWQRFLNSNDLPVLPQPEPWGFGNNPQMANDLAQLVVQGIKTATSSAVTDPINEPPVQVGDYDIVLDGQQQPVAIIKTVVQETMPFNRVTAEHAYHEGEGDRTLANWRSAHEAFWRQELAQEAIKFSDQLSVSCEVFELVVTPTDLGMNENGN
ncbi:ASCH domain-containing protein [Furfurilactobacillus curtus]|uniref:RNA-binding protein n=1 Tax=Furfurilactobacillus curtus TaxID=1746200 RepID=A0ABQ5JMM4_9LACO